MSAHTEGEKTGTCDTVKTVERKGGTGEGKQPPRSPHAQEKMPMLTPTLKRQKTAMMPYGLRAREALAHVHI